MPVDNPSEGATKEFWIPVAADSNCGDFAANLVNASGGTERISFFIPHDFSSIVEIVAVIIPNTTDSEWDLDIASDYATADEPYNTHSESETSTTYNLTNNQIAEIDLSPVLTSIAAGDYVGIKIENNKSGYGIMLLGIRFRYQ